MKKDRETVKQILKIKYKCKNRKQNLPKVRGDVQCQTKQFFFIDEDTLTKEELKNLSEVTQYEQTEKQ